MSYVHETPHSASQGTKAPLNDGVVAQARKLGASVLEHVALRGELLSVELQDEFSRLAGLAVTLALTIALAVVSAVFIGMAILVGFWDSPYRLTVAIMLALVFASTTLICGRSAMVRLRQPTHLLRDSIAELRTDAGQLRAAVVS